jgi:hypothetical protein
VSVTPAETAGGCWNTHVLEHPLPHDALRPGCARRACRAVPCSRSAAALHYS